MANKIPKEKKDEILSSVKSGDHTIKQAAELGGVSEKTVRKWIRDKFEYVQKIRPYNFHIHSIFDIEKYLIEKGYEVEFVSSTSLEWPGFRAAGTGVYVSFPLVDVSGPLVFAEIMLETNKGSDTFVKDTRIFFQLLFAFGVRDDKEWNQSAFENIKDKESIEQYLAERRCKMYSDYRIEN